MAGHGGELLRRKPPYGGELLSVGAEKINLSGLKRFARSEMERASDQAKQPKLLPSMKTQSTRKWNKSMFHGRTFITEKQHGADAFMQIAEVTGIVKRTHKNAMLLASAPELLSTLENIVEAIWDGRLEADGAENYTDDARLLIRRAKGHIE